MIIQNIDKGNPFDWGKTSEDYAKYRDIYPQEFYDYILTWYHRMSSESTSRLPEIPGMGGCGPAGA